MSTAVYLGPEGTYSHLVAKKRHGKARLVALNTIAEVCAAVAGGTAARGIVPIENSSGGPIYDTIDALLSHTPELYIEEELALDVKLALLGHPGSPRIERLYSHFAPLRHCETWLKTNLGDIDLRATSSTALAAAQAASDSGAAALGPRGLAKIHGLAVLKYPVGGDMPNLTHFFSIVKKPVKTMNPKKITLGVRLHNKPGSLYDLLGVFKQENINLTRLISRPIPGKPREYAFFIDLDGGTGRASMKRALADARQKATMIKVIGSYPSRVPYQS